jgi:hypothetical protein
MSNLKKEDIINFKKEDIINFKKEDIINLEKEIDSLDEIKEWSKKMEKMKELKEKINLQKTKINSLIETINSGEVKKDKKKSKKDLNLDDLLVEFENCKDMDEKVKLFNQIQSMLKDNELELFDPS